MQTPKCIHVPKLVAGRAAQISWEGTNDIYGVVLERRWAGEDGVFPEAYEEIFSGLNFPNPAMSWTELMEFGLTWGEMGTKTWDECNATAAHIPRLGFEVPIPVEDTHPALSWEDIGRSLHSWRSIAERALSWRGIADVTGDVRHVAFLDQVPEEASWMEYRIKFYDDFSTSAYRSSGAVPVNPKVTVQGAWELDVHEGDIRYVLVDATGIQEFPASCSLQYDPAELKLEDVFGGDCEILSRTDGSLSFRSVKQSIAGKEWSAPVLVAKYSALQTATARVSLR